MMRLQRFLAGVLALATVSGLFAQQRPVIGPLEVRAPAAATVPFSVQGAASQSANLQTWENSSSTVLASISASGALSSAGLTASGHILAATDNTYDVGNSTSGGFRTGYFDTSVVTTALTVHGVTSAGATGTGNIVFSSSPTLVTPALGTPSSIILTNGTGLPISTGVSGLGTGVATFLGTPSSANLITAITDETGSGALVFATSPTLVTPTLGVATATRIRVNDATNDDSRGFYGGFDAQNGLTLDVAGNASQSVDIKARRSGGTQASRSNVTAGDINLRLLGMPYSGATGYWTSSSITFTVDGTVTDDQRPGGSIEFYSNTPNATPVANMRLRNDGRLELAQYYEMSEITAPSAPAANKARWYCQDNGGGKTQCGILFNTGAFQVLATEP